MGRGTDLTKTGNRPDLTHWPEFDDPRSAAVRRKEHSYSHQCKLILSEKSRHKIVYTG